MTQESRIVLIITLLLVLISNLSAEFIQSSILSNDIISVDGNGDTLWMATSHGVNFTTNFTSDSIRWMGNKDLSVYKVFYSNGKSYMSLFIDDEIYKNKMAVYDHAIQSVVVEDPGFKKSVDSSDVTFFIEDFEMVDTTLWFAASDGGVVNYKNAIEAKSYIPGDSTGRYPQAVNPSSSDVLKKVISLSYMGNNKLWVGGYKCLWVFDIDSLTWDSIGFPEASIVPVSSSILEIYSNSDDTASVNLLMELNDEDTVYSAVLVNYNKESGKWRKISNNTFTAAAYGSQNDLFAVYESGDKFSRFDVSDTLFADNVNSDDSKERIDFAQGAPLNFGIQDICFSSSDNYDILVIATSKGLFYSLDEYSDEIAVEPFNFLKRSIVLKSGLEQTYSYPSIITGNALSGKNRSYFAYNLAENSNVSIDIYDFNMDHVVRIIDETPRNAGKNNPSGRSTVESQDYWDGTAQNNGGKSVPPGVYYYKIKTDKGEKAFGKVIVAKN